MPPLICGSPLLFDQSFPRNNNELRRVAATLGEIEQQINQNSIHLIITEELKQIINAFDWSKFNDYPILRDIYRLLSQWFLQPHDRIIDVNLSNIVNHSPHPIPEYCALHGLVDIWSDELGRLLVKHDRHCPQNCFFIGIACELAYTGNAIGSYHNPSNARAFPLVGPEDKDSKLIDAYNWVALPNIQQRHIYVADFFRNYKAIGATRIERPSSGSHFKVRFKNKRSWTLDTNVDPIPHRFIDELEQIAEYPKQVIKTALTTGERPRKIIRFTNT